MSIQSKLIATSTAIILPLFFNACSPDDGAKTVATTLTNPLSSQISHTAGAYSTLNIDNKLITVSSQYGQNQVYNDNTISQDHLGDHIILQQDPAMAHTTNLSIELSSDFKTISNFRYTDENGIVYDKISANYTCNYLASSDDIASAKDNPDIDTNGLEDYYSKLYQCKIESGAITNSANNSINLSSGVINIQEIYYKINLLDAI